MNSDRRFMPPMGWESYLQRSKKECQSECHEFLVRIFLPLAVFSGESDPQQMSQLGRCPSELPTVSNAFSISEASPLR
jgi:hypothetical protein